MVFIVKDSIFDQFEFDMFEKEVKIKDKGDIVLVNLDRVILFFDFNKGKIYIGLYQFCFF